MVGIVRPSTKSRSTWTLRTARRTRPTGIAAFSSLFGSATPTTSDWNFIEVRGRSARARELFTPTNLVLSNPCSPRPLPVYPVVSLTCRMVAMLATIYLPWFPTHLGFMSLTLASMISMVSLPWFPFTLVPISCHGFQPTLVPVISMASLSWFPFTLLPISCHGFQLTLVSMISTVTCHGFHSPWFP